METENNFSVSIFFFFSVLSSSSSKNVDFEFRILRYLCVPRESSLWPDEKISMRKIAFVIWYPVLISITSYVSYVKHTSATLRTVNSFHGRHQHDDDEKERVGLLLEKFKLNRDLISSHLISSYHNISHDTIRCHRHRHHHHFQLYQNYWLFWYYFVWVYRLRKLLN